MRIAGNVALGIIAIASLASPAAGCTQGSSTPPTAPTAPTPPTQPALGAPERQPPASDEKREARARDLAIAADAQIRQLEEMRPRAVDLGVATQIEAHVATISRQRDEVLADLGSRADPERLDSDTSNLKEAMREATVFRPQPLMTPPLVPWAPRETGYRIFPPSR